MKITAKQLIAAGACKEQINLFKKLFGKETTITVAKCRKVAQQFNWGWAARRLFTAPARAEYDRVTASAWTEYDRATASARAAYDRATASAWAAYDRATASALAEYNRARANTWAAVALNGGLK